MKSEKLVRVHLQLRHLANNCPQGHSDDESGDELILCDDTDTVSEAFAG